MPLCCPSSPKNFELGSLLSYCTVIGTSLKTQQMTVTRGPVRATLGMILKVSMCEGKISWNHRCITNCNFIKGMTQLNMVMHPSHKMQKILPLVRVLQPTFQFNTQYMRNPDIVYVLKMEYVWNVWLKVSLIIFIFTQRIFLRSLHA